MAEEIVEINEEKPSLLGIITNPTKQFERIRNRPVFWGALIIVIVISMIGLMLTSFNVELTGLEDLTEDEIALGKIIGTASVMILGIFTTVISVLFSTAIYLLIARINKAQVTFKQMFSMHTYIILTTALSLLVNGIIINIFGDFSSNDTIFTSIGSFVDVDGPMGVLLDHLEVFSIWGTILTAIGLQKVVGFTKSQAWVVVLAFFFVGTFLAMTGLEPTP